jgi:hypothetical protein
MRLFSLAAAVTGDPFDLTKSLFPVQEEVASTRGSSPPGGVPCAQMAGISNVPGTGYRCSAR